MKYYKILPFMILAILLTNCQNYDELVKNKNLPTSAPPALLLTGAMEHLNNQNAWNGKQGSQSAAQFWISTYDYYGTNNYDQAPFTKSTNNFEYTVNPSPLNQGPLQDLVQMDLEAKKLGLPDVNVYGALGKFLRAYYFNLMSQKMGDLPLSQALKGVETTTPVYDTQKDIYIQILKWLDESNSDLSQLIASSATLSGDVFLGNNLSAWQKVVNSFTLRVLIALSKKENESGLNVKQKFADIVGNPVKYPVITGLGDNLQYVYNANFNNYPKNPTSKGRDITRENIGAPLLNLTTTLKDPRTFVFATPAPALIASGKLFNDYAAYAGADPGMSMSDLGNNAQGGKYSYVNPLRYYADFAGSKAEPAIIIGYPELCFNIAEGINRGWATGSATVWYEKGITAAMSHVGITEGSSVTVADIQNTIYGTVTGISVAAYLAQPAVQYQGGAAGLTQILNQKYIAFWQNSNWEAFFNQRRTGVPTFTNGPGSGNANRIALRWQYPVAESTANQQNYNAAIQRQYGGVDDLNGRMWILQ